MQERRAASVRTHDRTTRQSTGASAELWSAEVAATPRTVRSNRSTAQRDEQLQTPTPLEVAADTASQPMRTAPLHRGRALLDDDEPAFTPAAKRSGRSAPRGGPPSPPSIDRAISHVTSSAVRNVQEKGTADEPTAGSGPLQTYLTSRERGPAEGVVRGEVADEYAAPLSHAAKPRRPGTRADRETPGSTAHPPAAAEIPSRRPTAAAEEESGRSAQAAAATLKRTGYASEAQQRSSGNALVSSAGHKTAQGDKASPSGVVSQSNAEQRTPLAPSAAAQPAPSAHPSAISPEMMAKAEAMLTQAAQQTAARAVEPPRPRTKPPASVAQRAKGEQMAKAQPSDAGGRAARAPGARPAPVPGGLSRAAAKPATAPAAVPATVQRIPEASGTATVRQAVPAAEKVAGAGGAAARQRDAVHQKVAVPLPAVIQESAQPPARPRLEGRQASAQQPAPLRLGGLQQAAQQAASPRLERKQSSAQQPAPPQETGKQGPEQCGAVQQPAAPRPADKQPASRPAAPTAAAKPPAQSPASNAAAPPPGAPDAAAAEQQAMLASQQAAHRETPPQRSTPATSPPPAVLEPPAEPAATPADARRDANSAAGQPAAGGGAAGGRCSVAVEAGFAGTASGAATAPLHGDSGLEFGDDLLDDNELAHLRRLSAQGAAATPAADTTAGAASVPQPSSGAAAGRGVQQREASVGPAKEVDGKPSGADHCWCRNCVHRSRGNSRGGVS